MTLKLRSRLLALAATFAFTGAAFASPFVFVSPKDGSAWWTNKPMVRPMGKSVGVTSVQALNAWRAANEVTPDDLCYAEPLSREAVVGLDRQSQLEIEKTFQSLKHDPFRVEFKTPDGRAHIAQSAVFQECDGTAGGIFIVTQKANSEIELLKLYNDDPFTFVFPGEGATLVGISGCFECGDWTSLYYDGTRRKFYLEYEGD